jgi:hypothetical protein
MANGRNELIVTLPETAAIEVRRSGGLVPAMIAAGGEQARWRYIEFFTANIRNKNTRRAYARACARFFAWRESRNLALTAIRPFDVGAYVEILQGDGAAPGVKQELAAIRMLFDGWLWDRSCRPTRPPQCAGRLTS